MANLTIPTKFGCNASFIPPPRMYVMEKGVSLAAQVGLTQTACLTLLHLTDNGALRRGLKTVAYFGALIIQTKYPKLCFHTASSKQLHTQLHFVGQNTLFYRKKYIDQNTSKDWKLLDLFAFRFEVTKLKQLEQAPSSTFLILPHAKKMRPHEHIFS